MKRISLFLFLAAGLLALPACNEVQPSDPSGTLSVVIVDGDAPATKASDTSERTYERKINNLQIFVFDSGTLYRYERIDRNLNSFPYTKDFGSVKAGNYSVWVVANADDLGDVASEEELAETCIFLTDCGLTDAEGFVMADSGSVTVSNGSTATAAVSLTRFASRVRLVSVTNEVPEAYSDAGAVTVQGVFLINALGTWNLAGSGSASEWVNLGGRDQGAASSSDPGDYISSSGQVNPYEYVDHVYRDETVRITNGSTQTFSNCCLYSFPNDLSGDHTGNTATNSSGALTRLVVMVTVNGEDWWYPVTLYKNGSGLERNTSYDVRLTLRGTGSTDPNEPVGKGDLTAVVSVTSWEAGAEYDETI